jgi:hypothetical protein
MDEEQFRKRLSQVAEWSIPVIPTEEIKKLKRGRKNNEELYQDAHQEMFNEMFNGINPTYAPKIDAVKQVSETCSDCGLICEQGRKKDFKYCQGKKKSIWREKCLNCSKYKNPYTGQFNMDSNRSQSAINSYVNGTNPDNTVYSIFELNSKEQT